MNILASINRLVKLTNNTRQQLAASSLKQVNSPSVQLINSYNLNYMALSRPVYKMANKTKTTPTTTTGGNGKKTASIETTMAYLSPMKKSSSNVVTSDTDEPNAKIIASDEDSDSDIDSGDSDINLPRGLNPNPRNFALEQRIAARKEETRTLTKSRQKEVNKYKRYLINDNIQKLLKKYSVY